MAESTDDRRSLVKIGDNLTNLFDFHTAMRRDIDVIKNAVGEIDGAKDQITSLANGQEVLIKSVKKLELQNATLIPEVDDLVTRAGELIPQVNQLIPRVQGLEQSINEAVHLRSDIVGRT